ncbi:MAG: class I SAM-dependent methyltransferase [Desulfobacteraceae bacterium]
MTIDFEFAARIKGFMPDHEAERLHGLALEAAETGPLLEIGSYCGKSAYFIGKACFEKGSVLFSLDHHRGSEEQQPGEEFFDPDLFDEHRNRIDTFPFFRQTLENAGLQESVVPVVADSKTAGKMWATPLSMVFIDGGHSFEAVLDDYETWHVHIVKGGTLVIHDIFFDPEEGGQAPRLIYETALSSNLYEPLDMTGTLGVLRRL